MGVGSLSFIGWGGGGGAGGGCVKPHLGMRVLTGHFHLQVGSIWTGYNQGWGHPHWRQILVKSG